MRTWGNHMADRRADAAHGQFAATAWYQAWVVREVTCYSHAHRDLLAAIDQKSEASADASLEQDKEEAQKASDDARLFPFFPTADREAHVTTSIAWAERPPWKPQP